MLVDQTGDGLYFGALRVSGNFKANLSVLRFDW